MYTEKIIETRLDLDDVNEIFCKNYDDMLLTKLRNKFSKICYKSCFILDVKKIIDRSRIRCKNKVLDGSMYIDVVFLADVLIYETHEVIHNCKILKIDNGIIHAKAENVALQIKNNKNIEIFKVDQNIPVIVMSQGYNPFLSEISILAIPLQPIKKPKICYSYKGMDDHIDEKHLEYEMSEIAKFEQTLADIKTKNSNIYSFFIETLYPFAQPQQQDKSTTIVPIKKITTIDADTVIFRPTSKLDDDGVHTTQIFDDCVVYMNRHDIMLKMLFDYKKDLYKLHGFLTTYDTIEKMKDTKVIWQMYKILKF